MSGEAKSVQTRPDVKRISDPIEFLGFGPVARTPDVVFLGTEESNGGGGKAAWQARLQFFQLMDMYTASVALAKADPNFEDPYKLWKERGRNKVKQWNAAARFRLALAGESFEQVATWSAYWREQLGRTAGDTLMMECFHVPRPRSGKRVAWYDGNPVTRWKQRCEILQAYTSTIAPSYVVAYGRVAEARVEALFPITLPWRSVAGGRASVARTANGGVVARVRFFGNGFALQDIPVVRDAMWKLGQGACPLRRRTKDDAVHADQGVQR